MQEEIGLRSITDGEYRRGVFYADFVCRGLGGATIYYESERMFFVDDAGNKIAVPLLKIHGRLKWRGPVHVDDFRLVQSLTRQTVKITLPSPTIPYAVDGRNVEERAYPDLDLLRQDIVEAYQCELRALAEAGCRYVQLDEVVTSCLCDQKQRAILKLRGDDPDALLGNYATAINRIVRERPPGMTVAMHTCRGNYQGHWMAEGGYDPIAERVFNEIDVDAFFLEYDSPRAGSFEPLRFVPKGKTVVLGLVSTKTPQLESEDLLKSRIAAAARFVPLEQLCLSPQCGFSSNYLGNPVTIDDERRKLELVVRVAESVWGGA